MRRARYLSVAAVVLVASILGVSCGNGFGEGASFDAAERSGVSDDGQGIETRKSEVPVRDLPMTSDVAIARTPETPPEDQPAERLRVYSANLDLGVASVDNARDTIVEITQGADGYVESSQDSYVVVRIPAAAFDRVLAEIETIGTILSRSVQTADVTSQYSDLQRRLEIALAARNRLNLLLAQTGDADERVAILREIRRLTEEIELLRASFESLAQLIAYSRITVRLSPRLEGAAIRSHIPFPWIARLAPLSQTTGEASFRIRVALPESFAVFRDGRLVSAEAADGTKLRIGAVPNDPVGDEQFWARALEYHLGSAFRRTTSTAAGSFHGATFEGNDQQPYHYSVFVAVIGDELLIVEVFYPNEDALQARSNEIAAMLREVEL